MDRLESLLSLLADGQQHSGQALGEALGVSRAAVWKLVAKLRELGLDVESGAGTGYRLQRPVSLLDAELIRKRLSGEASNRLGALDVALSIGSTNEALLRDASSATRPRALLAEAQSAGRGRRGRQWYSPFGASLYLSMLWPFDELGHGLQGLSLVAGLALADAIETVTGVPAGLKWPNDLVYQDRKLAGVLVEVIGEPQGPCQVVIGVGVNCDLPSVAGESIDQPWADLASQMDRPPDRNALAASIINNWCESLPRFASGGFTAFQKQWMQRDALLGRPVVLHVGHESISGVADGVDGSGALLLNEGGKISAWVSGEVSVRLAS